MRIKHKVRVQIARDTDMKNKQFHPDDTEAERVIDGYDGQVNGDLAIPQGTNEDLPTGDLTAIKGIYLEVDKDVKIKLNGGAEELDVATVADANGVTKAEFFLEATLTAVNVAAPASEDVSGVWCMWGNKS